MRVWSGPQLSAAASRVRGSALPRSTSRTIREFHRVTWWTEGWVYPRVSLSPTCALATTHARTYCTQETSDVPSVAVDTLELMNFVQKGNVHLIDVREPSELEETGKITPDAINIPIGDVEDALQMSSEEFEMRYGGPKPQEEDSNRLIFYCMVGVRSLRAVEVAQALGYSQARHYARGWKGWEENLELLKNQE